MWLALYFLTIGGDGILLGWLVKKRVWKTHPAFFSLIAFSFARTVFLWTLRAATERTHYRDLWWFTEPIVLALLGWVIGELWRKSSEGLVSGITVGFCLLAMIRLSFALYPKHIDYAWALAITEISIVRYASLVAAAFAMARVWWKESSRAFGLLMVSFVDAIVMDRNIGDVGYVTVLAWSIALIIWLRWAMKYRVLKSEQTRPWGFSSTPTSSSRKPSPSRRGVAP